MTTHADEAAGLLRFTMNDINEQPLELSTFAGKVVLFVNVASKCGYTPQYTGLQALYEKYKDQGLVVVGVPANNFGGQEPGTNAQVAEFCSVTYGVTFPMLAKVSVKGDDMCELYSALVAATQASDDPGDVSWNFEKFLLGRDGYLIARYRSKVKPDDAPLVEAIEAALNAG
jgi:glutathione peroxidase